MRVLTPAQDNRLSPLSVLRSRLSCERLFAFFVSPLLKGRLTPVLALLLAVLAVPSSRAIVHEVGSVGFISYVTVMFRQVESFGGPGWTSGGTPIYWTEEYVLGEDDFLHLDDSLVNEGDPDWWHVMEFSCWTVSSWLEPIPNYNPPGPGGGGGGGGGGSSGGGGSTAPPDSISNLMAEADDGSIFVSWTNPTANFTQATVVWSTNWDFASVAGNPNNRAVTSNGYFTIEGLSNGATYNVWVIAEGPGGFANYTFFPPAIQATPRVPFGFAFGPDSAVADMTDEETTADNIGQTRRQREREIRDHSQNRGTTLRSLLNRLNAALTTAIAPLIYNAQVQTDARQVGIRIAREAYLIGEITAEQYIAIAEYILNMNLPAYGMYQGQAEVAIGTVRNAAHTQVQQAVQVNESRQRNQYWLYRTGNASSVAPAKAVKDFFLPVGSPENSVVGPVFPYPKGASAFASVPLFLNPPYWRLLPNAPIPEGIAIISDGDNVLPGSGHIAGHHTIYPTESMSLELCNSKMRNMQWIRYVAP